MNELEEFRHRTHLAAMQLAWEELTWERREAYLHEAVSGEHRRLADKAHGWGAQDATWTGGDDDAA